MNLIKRLAILAVWLGTLGVAFVAGAFAHKYRARIRAYFAAVQGSPLIQTNLYNLQVRKVSIPGEGRDGAIAALDRGLLYVNRSGRAWFVDSQQTLHPLALQVPINVAEFQADPYNANTEFPERFAVKDILIQRHGDSVRLLASFNWWDQERDCNVLRVAALQTSAAALTDSVTAPEGWRTVYQSAPCRELIESGDGVHRHPTLGAGGRLSPVTANDVLVTVGEFSAEYTAAPATEGPPDSYGKTILIDVAAGTSRTWTSGHRNPQGLATAPDGRVWLTEHGARGGDELNLIVPGRDYGTPHVTYGTQYEMMIWPGSPAQGRHEGFEKPVYAWVPSIGISQLLVIEGRQFPWWTGDLLATSLAAQSIYRVRVEEGRVIFVEPITIGHRIRDVAETAGGSIVLLTDDNFLVYLDNIEAQPAASLEPAQRGALLATQCTSCHTVAQDAVNRIGPNLHGIVGRRVAAQRGYNYSDALRRTGGDWTEERLRRFLADPTAFAPGTSMQTTTRYDDQQLDDMMAYLRTLR